MITVLILLICVAALYTREKPALLLAALILGHDLASQSATGWGYYLSAATVDLTLVMALSTWAKPSRLTDGLLLLSFCSLLLNFYGWVIWFAYLPPNSYNLGFIVLYSVAIYIILRGKGARLDNPDILSFARAKSPMVYRAVL